MDLVDTLRKRISTLIDGEYVSGLKAVLLHIETAFRHLSRGQKTGDETAFTDAIYRTNQAFEGSVKEAYRVLANQDPAKKRPYDIENYLEQNSIFRPRVLSQLTTYRTEWRNPSTHNYKLDFDESEAFLAIITVTAFACLLLDQIAEHLVYLKTQAETQAQQPALNANLTQAQNPDFMVRVTELLIQFYAAHLSFWSWSSKPLESEVIGALHGFLSTVAPELNVVTEAQIGGERRFRIDLLIRRGDEYVVVELKRYVAANSLENAVAQVENYLLEGGYKNGVVMFWPIPAGEIEIREIEIGEKQGRIVVLSPAKKKY